MFADRFRAALVAAATGVLLAPATLAQEEMDPQHVYMMVERLDYLLRSADQVLDSIGPGRGSPAADDDQSLRAMDASLRTSAAALERLRQRACAMERLHADLCEARLTPEALAPPGAPARTLSELDERRRALELTLMRVTDAICEQAVVAPDAEYRPCATE